jgi:hypothetical protein
MTALQTLPAAANPGTVFRRSGIYDFIILTCTSWTTHINYLELFFGTKSFLAEKIFQANEHRSPIPPDLIQTVIYIFFSKNQLFFRKSDKIQYA